MHEFHHPELLKLGKALAARSDRYNNLVKALHAIIIRTHRAALHIRTSIAYKLANPYYTGTSRHQIPRDAVQSHTRHDCQVHGGCLTHAGGTLHDIVSYSCSTLSTRERWLHMVRIGATFHCLLRAPLTIVYPPPQLRKRQFLSS